MNALKRIAVAIAITGISGQVFASDFFVLPKKDNTGVYRDEIRKTYEEPAFFVSTGDVLIVMQSGKDSYFIKNRSDEKGWMEKQECVKAPRGASLTIDTAIINTDWADLRTFINIAGDGPVPEDPLSLDRSFKTELLTNVDNEEITRGERR